MNYISIDLLIILHEKLAFIKARESRRLQIEAVHVYMFNHLSEFFNLTIYEVEELVLDCNEVRKLVANICNIEIEIFIVFRTGLK